jgi:hypothetical protein
VLRSGGRRVSDPREPRESWPPDDGDQTGRLRPTAPRSRKRKLTAGFAAILCALSLAAGIVIGYVARGGPPEQVLVTNTEDIPAVTLTTELPAP